MKSVLRISLIACALLLCVFVSGCGSTAQTVYLDAENSNFSDFEVKNETVTFNCEITLHNDSPADREVK